MRSIESTIERPRSRRGEPVWEVADLQPVRSPLQGDWTEEDFISLDTNRLIEFTHGLLEFPEPPTPLHQIVVGNLLRALDEFVGRGNALFHMTVKLSPCVIRMPDICHFDGRLVDFKSNDPLSEVKLVMEVLNMSAASRERDLVTNRREYADAGIVEYWIADPDEETITVLSLDGKHYEPAGEYKPGQKAASVLLRGFEIEVAEAFRCD